MRVKLMLVIALALVAGAAQNLFAVTHVTVGACPGPGAHPSTIGAAITAVASSPGAIIGVCPGTYHEQLTITSPLTLQGIADGNADAVVIMPPAAGLSVSTTDLDTGGNTENVAAVIWVSNTPGPVNIANLTVDGTGNKYNTDDLRGILYQGASGTVNHVAVRNMVPNDTPTGDQSGQGIFVEADTGAATLTVDNCSVHNYNKNGIVARYGAFLTATANYVQGSGPIGAPLAAQNGIELFHAGGAIKNNTVIDNFYTSSPQAADILFYDTTENDGNSVTGNTLGNSNTAISLVTDTASLGDIVTVTNNRIIGTATTDAIDVCTNDNTITHNIIYDSVQSGIHLDSSCAGGTGNYNTVNSNTIVESACAGILTDPGEVVNNTGPPNNTFYTVPLKITTSPCTLPTAPVRAKTQRMVRP